MGMVGEACLLSNAYYPRTPDYTLYSGVHVCWSEHSNSSFVYGFISLDYGLGTMTATTCKHASPNMPFSLNRNLGKYVNNNCWGLESLFVAWNKNTLKNEIRDSG